MAEDREALLEHYRQTRQGLLAAIEGLSEAQMTEPSLDGWSVKDHLAHLAQWDDIRASEVVRISAGYDSAWRMTGEQDAAYNDLQYALRRSLSLDQIRWELAPRGSDSLRRSLPRHREGWTLRSTVKRVSIAGTRPCTRDGSGAGGRNAASKLIGIALVWA
jgi:uncharacterized damage-inducible protein DinB